MTLAELLDAAYTSENIALNNLCEVKSFAMRWKYFLTFDIEDIKISKFPICVVDPITKEVNRCLPMPSKISLNECYKYLIE